MLKAGLIGFGGITGAHINGYKKLFEEKKVQLICAYDIEPDAFAKKLRINISSGDNSVSGDIRTYTNLDEMLANEELDFVDICIPSYLHCDMTCNLLKRGYHVLCEKPMALNFKDCEKMIATAKETDKHLMIAQCLRFFPEYQYAKEVIDSGKYGKVISAFFSRLSPPPIWGWQGWFMDFKRSGGCITDMHIHDIDMARYLFGEPDAVSSRATDECSPYATVQTSLFYGSTPITAVGDWTRTGTPFSAGFDICLEKATLIFNSGKLTVYPKDGTEPFCPELDNFDGYTGEISYFCDIVSGKMKNTRNPATSAAQTIALIERMIESANNNGAVIKLK